MRISNERPPGIYVQQMTAPVTIGWKIHETIGPGLVNPRAFKALFIQQATGEALDSIGDIVGIERYPVTYIPFKSRWQQIIEEIENL